MVQPPRGRGDGSPSGHRADPAAQPTVRPGASYGDVVERCGKPQKSYGRAAFSAYVEPIVSGARLPVRRHREDRRGRGSSADQCQLGATAVVVDERRCAVRQNSGGHHRSEPATAAARLYAMSQTVRGVISRSKKQPVELVDIVIPDPGSRRGGRRHHRLRGLPHRPDLPRGRHQRRVPVPARPRGRRHRRVHRRGRHQRRGRRLRHPELARGVRAVPGLQARPPPVLLRHPQRRPEDDPDRRHRTHPRAGHRRVRRQDPRPRGPVHQGRSRGRPRRGRPARLRRDGRHRRGHQHRQRRPRRHRRGHRLRRRR